MPILFLLLYKDILLSCLLLELTLHHDHKHLYFHDISFQGSTSQFVYINMSIAWEDARVLCEQTGTYVTFKFFVFFFNLVSVHDF